MYEVNRKLGVEDVLLIAAHQLADVYYESFRDPGVKLGDERIDPG